MPHPYSGYQRLPFWGCQRGGNGGRPPATPGRLLVTRTGNSRSFDRPRHRGARQSCYDHACCSCGLVTFGASPFTRIPYSTGHAAGLHSAVDSRPGSGVTCRAQSVGAPMSSKERGGHDFRGQNVRLEQAGTRKRIACPKHRGRGTFAAFASGCCQFVRSPGCPHWIFG